METEPIVSVLNETGGRSVKMWDRLSAHEAYIIALYRHRIRAIEIIGRMVDEYTATITSGRVPSATIHGSSTATRSVMSESALSAILRAH